MPIGHSEGRTIVIVRTHTIEEIVLRVNEKSWDIDTKSDKDNQQNREQKPNKKRDVFPS